MKRFHCLPPALVLCLLAIETAAQIVSPAEFRHELHRHHGVLLDVRTPEEFNAEHIRGAVNINYLDSSFASEVQKRDRRKTYFVYCGVGKRSAGARQFMISHGFGHVYALENGLDAWKASGYKTVRKKGGRRK